MTRITCNFSLRGKKGSQNKMNGYLNCQKSVGLLQSVRVREQKEIKCLSKEKAGTKIKQVVGDIIPE